MKSSKVESKTWAEDQCGVWLDTVQLKEKAKKKYTRPISKLLNPFVRGSGYSLAVALNFTQTKLEMPKTKQSSISTFFIARRRVLNKMSTAEDPNVDPEQPSLLSSSSTALTDQESGRKRSRDVDHHELDWESENISESKETQWRSSSPNMSRKSEDRKSEDRKSEDRKSEDRKSEDCEAEPGQERHPDASLVSDTQLLPQTWSQDPLLTFTQCSEGEFCLPGQRFNAAKHFSSSEENNRDILSEEAFRNVTNGNSRTSTQKSFSLPPEDDDDQENNLPSHSGFVLSRHRTQDPASPRKRFKRLWKESEDEKLEWMKPKSPVKKRARRRRPSSGDQESLETLFTQDSEGFRVIAHPGSRARSPMKDQTNVSSRTRKTRRPLVWEEEQDEVLFTQDSQGNVVIKH